METLKNKITKLSYKLILIVGFLLCSLIVPSAAYALSGAPPTTSPSTSSSTSSSSSSTSSPSPSINPCNQKNPTATSLHSCLKANPIIGDINKIVNFLSAAAGLVIVGSIIVGGIQYSAAGNNPNAVSAAKKRITDALIALFAFFFIFGFLQWLIPGGLLFS